MLESTNKLAAECYRRAEKCRRQADETTIKSLRDDWLAMEGRWLSLAKSYEFAERLEVFSGEINRQKNKPE